MDSILNDDSDNESETREWEQKYSGKSGFIFAIDTRKPMFEGGKESFFTKSFQCCLNAMLQIAREQRYDVVSIVLFGTLIKEGKFTPDGTVLLQPLYTPSVPNIKNIMSMIDGNFENITTKYGHGEKVSIEKVLDYCKKLFHFCKTKLYTKSVVLFTYDDNPHKEDQKSAHRARKQAEEMRDHGIDFDVIGLGSFDSSVFYKELVLTTRGELLKDWLNEDPVKKIADVEAEIASLTKKIARHYGMFYLGDTVQMKILFYKLYHEPKKLIWASKDHELLVVKNEDDQDEEENKTAENQNQEKSLEESNNISIFDQETQIMDSEKIKEEPSKKKREKYPLIGGEYIPMSKKELVWYEAKVSRGLTLIGFRPLSSIPLQTVIGEPYFIMPDSAEKAGEQLFSHFLHACLAKEVAPICWYSFNKTGKPSLVVLYPTEPCEYAKGHTHPYGFHLIKLPFSDMITDYSDDLPNVESSETQMNAAEGIVKKTTFNWTPDRFSDFEYKSRIAMIEAIAMEYEDVSEVIDQTDVDLEAISERLGDLTTSIMDFSHLSPDDLGKRGATDKPKTSRPKETKMEDPAYCMAKIKAGEANKLTVAQLRDLLKGEGIKSLSTLTKPRLVAIATERFCS